MPLGAGWGRRRVILGIRLFAVVWQCEGWRKAFILGMGLFLVYLVWDVVHTLTPVYCLRRKELRITLSQTVLLLAFGAWLVAVFVVLGPNSPRCSAPIASRHASRDCSTRGGGRWPTTCCMTSVP